MRRLNVAIWRLGFLIPMIPACWISYQVYDVLLTMFPAEYIVDLNDAYIHLDEMWLKVIPVILGCLGFVVNGLTDMAEVFDLEHVPPEPEEFPVPFLGFSKSVLRLPYTFLVIGGWMGLFCILVIIIPLSLPACLIALLSLLFLFPFLAVTDAIYLAVIYAARMLDRRQYADSTGSFVCPECGWRCERPDYQVGSARIAGLRPSMKGAFHVESETSVVPCFGSRGGRKDLPQSCPSCGAAASTREGRPFVVSMAGAPSSGKTSFVLEVMGELTSSSGNGKASRVSSLHPEHEAALLDYRAGLRRPTPVSNERPYVISLESPQFHTPRNVYMFDVGGGFFTGDVEADLQPQYSYNDAIVFVMDPTCVDPVATATSAYLGFIGRYRQFNRMDASERIGVPMAVVLTRADKKGQLGSGEGLRDRMADEGYFNLVNAMEKDFSSVSFHSCAVNKEDGSASMVMRELCGRAGADLAQFFRHRFFT